MAFKFNAILNFNGKQAVQNMKLTKKEMEQLRGAGQRMQKGFGQMAQGSRGAAMATAPFAVATALAVREASNFEEQMSGVQAVLLASKEDMIPLNKLTKQLGATTAFSAQQAGEGAENLARAGFTTNQIVSALPGVLDAAAASGVSLAEASDVVASNIGAFGLKAKDATQVADILALTTARTNTNFTQLAEGLKLAAPIASQTGMTLAETASALGVFANAGVKGTLGATALRSALTKLAKPSKEAVRLFGGKDGMTEALITIGKDGKKKLKPMEVIMANVAKAVQGAKNPLEAAGQAAELFGVRGTTAFSAFQKQLTESVPLTDKNMAAIQRGAKLSGENIDEFIAKGAIPKLVALRLELAGASGSAKEMAQIKLNNLNGQFTLFQSALSGFAIEIGSLLTGPLKEGLGFATNALSGLVAAFQILGLNATDNTEEFNTLNATLKDTFGSNAGNVKDFVSGFVTGVKEIVTGVKEGFAKAKEYFKPFFDSAGGSSESFGKLAAKILLIGAIAAPILATIVGGLFVLGPVITGIVGMFNVVVGVLIALKVIAVFVFSNVLLPLLAALFSPIGLIVAAIVGVIALIVIFRSEIADWGKTALNWLGSVWKFLWEGGKSALNAIGNYFKSAATLWFNIIKTFVSFYVGIWSSIFSVAGDVLSAIGEQLSTWGTEGIALFVKLKDGAVTAFTGIWSSISDGASMLWTSIKGALIDPMTNAFLNMPSLVMNKIRGIKNLITDNIPGASFFFGKSENKTSGSSSTNDKISSNDVRAGTESSKILNESMRQKKVTAPASAADTASAVAQAAMGGQKGAGGGSQAVNVTVGVTGKISGRDLNLVVTKQQVEVAEKNGISVNSEAKRKVKQNGQMLTGTGG